MSLFQRHVNYDRRRLLAEAERARAQGRRRRAIALYRRVLAVEPRNPQINARIAPLLAQTHQRFDAWQSFRSAAEAHISGSRAGEALALYREATRCLPRQVEAWQCVAEIERRHGRLKQARKTLLQGSRQLQLRRRRPEAIALLRVAREIEPWHPTTVLELARLLGRSHQAPEAQWLLGELANRSSDRQLQQVRGLQWRIEPSLRHTWRWLRAAVAAARSPRRPVPA